MSFARVDHHTVDVRVAGATVCSGFTSTDAVDGPGGARPAPSDRPARVRPGPRTRAPAALERPQAGRQLERPGRRRDGF
jgi:hypothetical protein